MFPTYAQGICAQPDLWRTSKNYKNKRFADAIEIGNAKVDILQEFMKAWGPPGLIAVILWVFLYKSERREEKKDARMKMLENQLLESYDERIAAADRINVSHPASEYT